MADLDFDGGSTPFDATAWARHFDNAPTLDSRLRYLEQAANWIESMSESLGLDGVDDQEAAARLRSVEDLLVAFITIGVALAPALFQDEQVAPVTQLRAEVADLRQQLRAEIDRRHHDFDLGR